MATPTVTNIETPLIELEQGQFRDELLNFTAAGTAKAGTILARTTASGKLGYFAPAGVGGLGVPVALLTYDVSATAGGVDIPIRALVSGVVNKNRLIIAADGTGANITPAHLDLLRDMGIVPIDVALLGTYPAT